MTSHAAQVSRYQQLRQTCLRVNSDLVGQLHKGAFQQGGQLLGILRQGILVFDNEPEMAILQDFCIHELRFEGRTTVERVADLAPYPPGSPEAKFLQAMRSASFTMIRVISPLPGVGAQVRDLVRGEDRLIIDFTLSRTAKPDWVIGSRLVTIDDVTMGTGCTVLLGAMPEDAGWGGQTRLQREAVGLLGPDVAPEQRCTNVAKLLRDSMERIAKVNPPPSAPERLVETPPSDKPYPQAPPPPKQRTGRNAPCPCGSGKKFKQCCG